ncbi:MAG: insulinase family protein [Prolixibacteraceae bacterium]|nr:insulinase family protein [Prolixibacteraceae bacterium]MBN2648817.1 insulinase family protein [Prolixibacteraceae bacterium]
MSKLFFYLAVILATILVKAGIAQTELSQTVPLEPELRTGVLDNGLTYYIRHNKEPKERASFYIIQNVGALLEEDNQNGLAHFLEHMSFNGTENFKGKGILNTLEKHGVAFGRNINAYTSFNETVYNLSEVPTTHEGLVDTCLLILHDWSDRLLLTEEEIDLERGVISEEWRTRRTASFRIRNQWFPVVFKGSQWAVRDVIGDTTVIKYHEPETLRKFYHDWYRTDLQAIAIVGDIDVDEIEAKVKKLFSEIEAVENPKERPDFKIPEHDETYFVLATDDEASQSSINMYIFDENKDGEKKTYNDWREMYINSLYNSMTSQRISELLQKGTPPFINGSTQHGGFVRGYDAYMIGTTANDGEEAKALEAIMIETQRVKQHGFVETELERAKTNLLTRIESRYNEREKISNDQFCSQYAENYLTASPVPGIEEEFRFAKEILPTITVEEVSAKANEWITQKNRAIIITGPTEAEHLSEAEAKAIIAKVEAMDVKPYVDAAAGSSLISEELKGSKIISEKKLKDFDAVEWTLANNTKVVYRHADYEKDNVSLMAYSNGGSSLWDDEYVPELEMLATFIEAYGVGDYDAVTLQKMLTGKKVSLSFSLGSLTEGCSGSSTPKDFETMMQLVYLYFEKPRFDQEAHNALMSRYKAFVANMQKDPSKIMQDSLSYIFYDYHPRVRTLDTEFLNEINFNDIQKIYNDRVKDAGDFTWFIVGNIDEETAKTMAQKYLGSLSDDPRQEIWKDRGVRAPEGKVEKVIPITFTTPKTNVNIRFVNDVDFTPKNNLAMKVLEGILDLRYTETIREAEGGTYGVGVGSGMEQYPVNQGTLRMVFDCDPNRANDLKAIIYREIDKIIDEGPTAVDFDKIIKNLLKDREQSREHNSFWLNSLYSFYFSGINIAKAENYEDLLRNMTQSDIQKFTKKFISDADVADVVFIPKSE